MSLAIVYGRAGIGIGAPLVTVEVHLTNGLPSLSIVGMPETAVRESKDRVRSALLNAGFDFPLRRITINLAPADLPKGGGRFDLPIAIGILAASAQIASAELHRYEFVAELSLTGELRPVQGVLPASIQASRHDRLLFVAAANAEEAACVKTARVVACQRLADVCQHLRPHATPPFYQRQTSDTPIDRLPDLIEVRAQNHARRALEVAAAGGHHLLMTGPPGSGKTMLASRLPSILPALSEAEALESAAIASISGTGLDPQRWRQRPFRAPHHTVSSVALVGGGSQVRPGEISLAHLGVLFLDELPEFERRVLEVLREPLESGVVTIARAARSTRFPARFQLVAAMNPCPCGYLGDVRGRCHCSTEQVRRYQARISGPLLDRIDIRIDVPVVPTGQLIGQAAATPECSADVLARVTAARAVSRQRNGCLNARLDAGAIAEHCALGNAETRLLSAAIDKFGLSARSTHRALRVARTIADLEHSPAIRAGHLGEALGYRQVPQTEAPGMACAGTAIGARIEP